MAQRRPHLADEILVSSDLELMPGPHRHVGDLVALRRAVGDHVPDGPLRPRPVTALGAAQPVVGPPGGLREPAGTQRHRALDMVPRVAVAVRPADRAVAQLASGDALSRGQDVIRGQNAGYRWRTWCWRAHRWRKHRWRRQCWRRQCWRG